MKKPHVIDKEKLWDAANVPNFVRKDAIHQVEVAAQAAKAARKKNKISEIT